MAPTMVIVPGSFGRSELYDPVVLPLRAKGYTIHALDPPCYPSSYKEGAPPPNMYDDAKFVHDFVEALADKGEEVVLFAHSYGGIPASQSLQGVTKTERAAQGKRGGVIHAAYLTAMVPKVGENLATSIKGGAPPMEVGEDGWLRQPSHQDTAALCFNSLSPEKGTELAKLLTKHSAQSFMDPLTYPGHKDVSVSWFFCEDDKCVSPEVQQTAIDTIEESWKGTEREGKKVEVTREKCDHIPIYSARDALEKWAEGLFAKVTLLEHKMSESSNIRPW
ncbi:alpha/beta-hydrolase [Setomelanomma holmii]|uniref:Alpha/beta-hydrolase n=1 Tax=Setomelanomma holmii TaxID=210430 RepID=A0A9P4LRE4_9PLEO|nr:alpha/beta-hydrolase [Setomelanomma holmii]